MRLVSAIWCDYGPFGKLKKVTELFDTSDPDDLKAGDILITHGGGDIHPNFYGKGRSRYSGASAKPSPRDLSEWALMQRAVSLGVPIIGICRGAQMLCALAGGYLIQHVNNHSGYHEVKTFDRKLIMVNSIHHQMMMPKGTKHQLLAWCPSGLSDVYYDEDEKVDVEIEPECIWFNDVLGFAVQWHPEMMQDDDEANVYILNYLNKVL